MSEWLNERLVEDLIKQRVNVTSHEVAVAKDFIMKRPHYDVEALIQSYLDYQDAVMPQQIHLHQSMQPMQVIEKAARSISLRLACCEAIWGLISSGHLIPASFQLVGGIPGLGYTTVLHGSGSSGGLRLDSIQPLLVPQYLRRPPSSRGRENGYLFDGDLYLNELNIPDLHEEVKEALRDAVACFRAGLFTPCLAMLGKASEGAWIEVGLALCEAAADPSDRQVAKTEADLRGDRVSVTQKIRSVTSLYSRRDILNDVHVACKVDVGPLQAAAEWSDLVRDSRNTVHYQVNATTRNTADKVSVLLLSACSSMRALYAIFGAAKVAARTRGNGAIEASVGESGPRGAS